MVKHTIKKAAKKALPPHTHRGQKAKRYAYNLGLVKHPHHDDRYQAWVRQVEPNLFYPPLKPKKGQDRPLFSIVIPFHNTPLKYLEPLFDSIVNQSFTDWELIAGDDSTDKDRSHDIKKFCERDKRITYHRSRPKGGISANTNEAIKKARGRFIVFADHDDVLSAHALNEVAIALDDHPNTEIFYSDEDKLTDKGELRHNALFKPDWSPHTFLNTNYTNHLSVIKKELVNKAGGLRTEFNGAQDWDLLLRVHNLPGRRTVHHIPKMLYHWREAEGSTAGEFAVKNYAIEAGRQALQEYIEREGWPGEVKPLPGRPGFHRIDFQPQAKKAHVIIAASPDQRKNELIAGKLRLKTTSKTLDINFVTAEDQKALTKLIKETHGNDAVFVIKTALLPYEETWIDQLAGVLRLDDVLTVAPRIVRHDGQVEDMGMVQLAGEYIPLFKECLVDDMTLLGHAEWVRDVASPTGVFLGFKAQEAKNILAALEHTDKKFYESMQEMAHKQNRYHVVWSHAIMELTGVPVMPAHGANANLVLEEEKWVPHV